MFLIISKFSMMELWGLKHLKPFRFLMSLTVLFAVSGITICPILLTAGALHVHPDTSKTPQMLLFQSSDWMRDFLPLLKGSNATLLDIALPGSHDSTTYDLVGSVSDNANDIPPGLAKVLHDLSKLLNVFHISNIIRNQAVTQGLNITEQLNSGVRFIDLRACYTSPPMVPSEDKSKYDFYGMHFLQTKSKILTFLKEIRDWLIDHPSEIVVVWISRQGQTGTGTFGVDTEILQKFWLEIEAVFVIQPPQSPHVGTMLWNHEMFPINTTPLYESKAIFQPLAQVIIYLGDFRHFFPSSLKQTTNTDKVARGAASNNQPKEGHNEKLYRSARKENRHITLLDSQRHIPRNRQSAHALPGTPYAISDSHIDNNWNEDSTYVIRRLTYISQSVFSAPFINDRMSTDKAQNTFYLVSLAGIFESEDYYFCTIMLYLLGDKKHVEMEYKGKRGSPINAVDNTQVAVVDWLRKERPTLYRAATTMLDTDTGTYKATYISDANKLADYFRKKCANLLIVPGITDYCPITALEVSQYKNYYAQKLIFEEVLSAAELDSSRGKRGGVTSSQSSANVPSKRFPNAIYINAIDINGTIRTGDYSFMPPIPPLGTMEDKKSIWERSKEKNVVDVKSKDLVGGVSPHALQRYSYLDTLLLATLLRICPIIKGSGIPTSHIYKGNASPLQCQDAIAILRNRRNQYPMVIWDDPQSGRLGNF